MLILFVFILMKILPILIKNMVMEIRLYFNMLKLMEDGILILIIQQKSYYEMEQEAKALGGRLVTHKELMYALKDQEFLL